MTREIILITGCHRSGTSAVAAALPCFDFSLGSMLMAANATNPKGHFEDTEIVAFNDSLLKRFGLDWKSEPSLSPVEQHSSAFDKYRERLADLLSTRLAQTPHFAIKDPRLSRLLPFWRDVIARMGIDPSMIFCVRSPLDVAASLARRDGFKQPQALELWHAYNSDCFANAPFQRSMFVNYAALMHDPMQELSRIYVHFDMQAWEAERVSDYTMNFIDRSLDHSEKRGKEKLPEEIEALWKKLFRLANDSLRLEDAA